MTVSKITQHLAAATIALAVAAGAVYAQATPPAPEKPATPEAAPRAYIPGLEVFMGFIQAQHAKLWLAARERNWDLVEYQVAELKEALGDAQELTPTYKNIPIADMIDAIITGPIVELETAAETRDFKKFSAAYDKLTESCNSCHAAASREFIVIRRPTASTFSNQDFAPLRK
jgi:hypothetical protein